ncbi:hypothetical protein EJ08DRAFT_647468 [Tothia fuscella]|uniref:Eisosome protein 1 n=1 Tax=Tothia fuscella TaxID=1048955 RepID=A0A9P4U0D2_9PEZI|nr:hypothetical protein EJ08DRAFT_647468 [Tothia fuscella]
MFLNERVINEVAKSTRSAPLATMTDSAQEHDTREPICPDPSLHEKAHRESKLQDQAAGAALYATKHEKDPNYPLGPDKKLSSAGAATSLKYARAQDLPSFPSVGIDTKNSGLTAATLANQNRHSVDWWTPELSADASKAAMLAKDYTMDPLWQPELSSASSKAALLAHQGKGRDWWQPTESAEGLSAAGIAMRNKGLSPQLDYGYTDIGKKNSLQAARLSVKGRKRAGSQPDPSNLYPDQHNAGPNALNAATRANANRLGPNSMPREMYTEHPPVDIEVNEKRHQDSLQASAIAMAKSMYAMQTVDDDGNITLNHGLMAAGKAHGARPTGADADLKSEAMKYINLQDAAQRLAAERLAKINTQHENAAFQDYWGQPQQKRRSRLSIRSGPGRRRAASEGREMDSDDERQARRVRSQMSQFNTQLAEVDAKKRGQDRAALLAAAERKVQEQMNKLDQKIYNETGTMSPAMVEDWDSKARIKAQARIAAVSEAREQNRGKVDIGGGKYLDQSEIDNIAAARVQPTLDRINETAEKQRARDAEIRLDEAEKKRQAHNEKQRQAELKSEQKRIKSEEKEAEKAKKHAEKEAAKHEKQVGKEKKSESSRLVKHEDRKSTEVVQPLHAPPATDAPAVIDTSEGPARNILVTRDFDVGRVPTNTASAETPSYSQYTTTSSATATKTTDSSPKSTEDSEMTSPTSKKRFSSIFSKLKRKSKKEDSSEKGTFQGGAALTNPSSSTTTQPATAATTVAPVAAATTVPRSHSPSISSLSSDEDVEPRGRTKSRSEDGVSSGGESELFEEARDRFDERLAPPPTFGSIKSESPVRDSKFIEAL